MKRIVKNVRKLLTGDAFHSTKAALRRLSYPLDPKPFIDAIDREGFGKIRARYHWEGERVRAEKYLNLEEWFRTNVKRVRDLRLKKAPPVLRVLDIGSGAGYFLHIARCMGHDVLGLDVEGEPLFRELFGLLGLERVIHRIEPFQPLPPLGAAFDLITAHMTCFNIRADGSHWGCEEWEFLLKDTASRLTPTGRLQFDLNVLPDGRHMAPELKKFFLSEGARIERRRVFLPNPSGGSGMK